MQNIKEINKNKEYKASYFVYFSIFFSYASR